MAIKKLQQNFTTIAQSKRLLELGLPSDSADCYLNSDSVIVLNSKTFQENYNEDLDLARLHLIEYPHYIPCWSVGRLIEILLLCHISDEAGIMFDKPLYEVSNCTNIEWCIRVLESCLRYKHIDFLKLN